MRRRKSSTRLGGRLAAALALVAALAAAGLRLAKRARPASASDPERSPAADREAPSPAEAETAETTYTCDCGTEYRVAGTDRHRIYWPADAPESEPVLGDRCVSCDAPLPSTPQAPAARTGDGA
jgi:hypothetical protein